jgi:hypothetical protein
VRIKRVDGKEYYQLVESRRVDGKPRQKVLLHLGQHEGSMEEFFNSAPWPLPSHPEAMKMVPSPALFSHQAGLFPEVPLYGVQRSSPCSS